MKKISIWLFLLLVVLFIGCTKDNTTEPIYTNANFIWAKSAGGTGSNHGSSIVIDAQGNKYVTGNFEGSATFGATTLNSIGGSDVFIAKMDVNGNWLWAIKAGGTNYDYSHSIAVDAQGNAYITGTFHGNANFDTTSLTPNGDFDIFIAKIDKNGNWLWVKQAGGTSYEYSSSIAIDAQGNCYIAGGFADTAIFGTISLATNTCTDIFIAKIDTNGNWQWAKQAGGVTYDYCYSIAVDTQNNINITGSFQGVAVFGTISLPYGNYEDIYVAKMDTNGNWLWAKQAGGINPDNGCYIATDIRGNSYITGGFTDTAVFGLTTLTSAGYNDIFIAKIDVNGNWLWAKQIGGRNQDYGFSVAVDNNGNAYLTGKTSIITTESINNGINSGTITHTVNGFFIAKTDANGDWLWIKQSSNGYPSSSYGHSIAVDAQENANVLGEFSKNISFDSNNLTSAGVVDIFVAKIK